MVKSGGPRLVMMQEEGKTSRSAQAKRLCWKSIQKRWRLVGYSMLTAD